MTWIVVLLAVVAVAVVARSLRAQAEPAPGDAEPRPGDGLPRFDVVENVPEGYVTLRAALPAEEAYVVHGLLVSGGIGAALKPTRAGLHPYTRQPAPILSVLVDAAERDEAEALLAEGETALP